MLIPLCKTDEITDPESRAFEIDGSISEHPIFLVFKDAEFHAYINSCPHTGVNLEWQENQFLDMDGSFIQCSTHDALFDISTGECIAGPCVGDFLTPIDTIIRDDTVYAQFPDKDH